MTDTVVRAPICPYCRAAAVLFETSERFYRGIDFGPVWACIPCEAWVGCHKNSRRRAPLGRLANKELRRAKIAAHAAFDQLWKARWQRERRRLIAEGLRPTSNCGRNASRAAGYAWLARQLGLEAKDCHIGMFDVERCQRVVEVCEPYLPAVRAP